VYGGSLDEGVVADIRGNMAAAGVWIEACNPESGPGQFELNIRYSEAMRAADDGFFYKYKHCVREIVARHEMLASFMAKPRRDWAGSSCHVHQSLWELDGNRNVFFGDAAGHGASAIARHYVGGLLATMRELSALFWPTPNSYKRNAPYSWAASSVSWGFDNRSTGLRGGLRRGRVCGPRVEKYRQQVSEWEVRRYLELA
jgi:glutamine synthetase